MVKVNRLKREDYEKLSKQLGETEDTIKLVDMSLILGVKPDEVEDILSKIEYTGISAAKAGNALKIAMENLYFKDK